MTQVNETEKTPAKPANLPDLPGVWRRDLIEALDVRDDQSQVFWLQGKKLFGDLRVEPSGKVAFSGHLTQEAAVFTWNMDLMSFDQPEFPDAGRLEFQGANLWEYGVHQTYTELWRKAGAAGQGDFALWLTHDDGRSAARLHIGGFDFAQFGRVGQPATSAIIHGTCPRFGSIDTCIGAPADIAPIFDISSPTALPPDWRVVVGETF